VAPGSVTTTAAYPAATQQMIDKLRILIRDNNPDRNYRFRPPEHEGTIGCYNQVFGYIWEDYELACYLEVALLWWNSLPPETEHLHSLGILLQQKPVWATAVLWGAMIHALFALSINWISEEFSVVGETIVRVALPDGRVVDVSIAELYSICYEEI